MLPHGVSVESSFSLGRNVIGWRQAYTRGETLWEEVVLRQFAGANNWMLEGNDPPFDTTNTENNLEMNKEPEEKTLNRMAKIHDFLEMWQGSQKLHATRKEYRTDNQQMTAVRYISEMEEIVVTSGSAVEHDAV